MERRKRRDIRHQAQRDDVIWPVSRRWERARDSTEYSFASFKFGSK